MIRNFKMCLIYFYTKPGVKLIAFYESKYFSNAVIRSFNFFQSLYNFSKILKRVGIKFERKGTAVVSMFTEEYFRGSCHPRFGSSFAKYLKNTYTQYFIVFYLRFLYWVGLYRAQVRGSRF